MSIGLGDKRLLSAREGVACREITFHSRRMGNHEVESEYICKCRCALIEINDRKIIRSASDDMESQKANDRDPHNAAAGVRSVLRLADIAWSNSTDFSMVTRDSPFSIARSFFNSTAVATISIASSSVIEPTSIRACKVLSASISAACPCASGSAPKARRKSSLSNGLLGITSPGFCRREHTDSRSMAPRATCHQLLCANVIIAIAP